MWTSFANIMRTQPLYLWAPLIAIGVLVGSSGLAILSKKGKLTDPKKDFLNAFLSCWLIVATLMAVGNYTNWGKWRYGSFLNAYEFYHYYMGSKYAEELGYTRLYGASLVADKATGLKYDNKRNTIRNLNTGAYIAVDDVLTQKENYVRPFTPERWEAFKRDIRWFKGKLIKSRWNSVLRDKGYNASPVWSMVVGGLLSNQVSTDNEVGMLLLSLIDVALLAFALGCITWAFGWRAAAFTVILVGTHYMMRFSHMKGAYIRTDFAVCLVASVCCLKKDRYGWAGFFTAYAILSRVFPAVFLFGLGAKGLWQVLEAAIAAGKDKWNQQAGKRKILALFSIEVLCLVLLCGSLVNIFRQGVTPANMILFSIPAGFHAMLVGLMVLMAIRRGAITPGYLRFFCTTGITLAILMGATVPYFGGTKIWKEYGEKIAYHNNDISPWRVGFKYLFIARFRSGEEVRQAAISSLGALAGLSPEKETQSTTRLAKIRSAFEKLSPYTRSVLYKENQLLWWVIMGFVLSLSLVAVRHLTNWEAYILGFVPCFFLVAPTYYYYIFLMVPLLFFINDSSRAPRWHGVLFLLLTGMAGYFFYSMWKQKFPTYFWLSVLMMLLSGIMLVQALRQGRTTMHWCGFLLVLSTAVACFSYCWPSMSGGGTARIVLVFVGFMLSSGVLFLEFAGYAFCRRKLPVDNAVNERLPDD